MKNLFDLSAYDYELPKALIASHPLQNRDESRLMIVDRQAVQISEIKFCELADFLDSGDQLILNDTRVIKARLFGAKETGAHIELFLVKMITDSTWEVMARPGRKLKMGDTVTIGPDFSCQIVKTLGSGNKVVRFTFEGDCMELLDSYGQMPLPHYMERGAEVCDDERYQTVYGKKSGALAAPTAGLHFTPELFSKLAKKGIDSQMVTLHVGLGTFKPVQVDDIREHHMHAESYFLNERTADKINAPHKRKICVGTTTCRVLETCSDKQGKVKPGSGETDIFIYPGYQFQCVKHLLTNFHLPGSSLIMLVCAFGGYELMMEAYRKAVEQKFRFYSYGDAMLIL